MFERKRGQANDELEISNSFNSLFSATSVTSNPEQIGVKSHLSAEEVKSIQKSNVPGHNRPVSAPVKAQLEVAKNIYITLQPT